MTLTDPTSVPEEPDPIDAPSDDRLGAFQVQLCLEVDDDDPPLAGWLEGQTLDAAATAGITTGSISIAVVGDTQMAQLHEQYKDVPGTTDVLTFDLADEPEQGVVEGEVIICLDEARRQAKQRGHSVRHEMLLYVVHGLLHLLGEDDHDPQAYAQMHAREDEILTALGIGQVFARPEGSS